MARYISEHSLQDYQFVAEKPSLLAAASMYLALRMLKLGDWVGVSVATGQRVGCLEICMC